ncbi:DUF5713 family protein [Streptomyces sp. NPDC057596]|uniref:DUF5713 family protein n=1 Tax=Streptomyces sp. NPDC057596 TaxID=3346178 RepID=UPI0036C6726A
MPITNQQVAGHAFLRQLYADPYFPDHVVDKGRAILLRLCERVESEQPTDLVALYALTEAATEEFNLLEAEFEAAGSEIETVAREEIAEDSPKSACGSWRRLWPFWERLPPHGGCSGSLPPPTHCGLRPR